MEPASSFDGAGFFYGRSGDTAESAGYYIHQRAASPSEQPDRTLATAAISDKIPPPSRLLAPHTAGKPQKTYVFPGNHGETLLCTQGSLDGGVAVLLHSNALTTALGSNHIPGSISVSNVSERAKLYLLGHGMNPKHFGTVRAR